MLRLVANMFNALKDPSRLEIPFQTLKRCCFSYTLLVFTAAFSVRYKIQYPNNLFYAGGRLYFKFARASP